MNTAGLLCLTDSLLEVDRPISARFAVHSDHGTRPSRSVLSEIFECRSTGSLVEEIQTLEPPSGRHLQPEDVVAGIAQAVSGGVVVVRAPEMMDTPGGSSMKSLSSSRANIFFSLSGRFWGGDEPSLSRSGKRAARPQLALAYPEIIPAIISNSPVRPRR